MNDPVEFLSAKLAEIEARARAAEKEAPSPWRSYEEQGIVEHSGPESSHFERGSQLWDSEGCREGWRRLCMDEAVAAHVAGMHPGVVLRLVAATRQVLELHHETTSEVSCDSRDCCAGPHEVVHCDGCGVVDDVCPTIRAIAVGWGWTED